MTQHGEHFTEFAAHTQLKHAVVKAYLAIWARKLLLRPSAGDVVWYVDGFAGEGMDEQGHPGSPLLAAQIAVEVERQIATMTGRSVRVRMVFFEQDSKTVNLLRTNLAPYAEKAEVIHGTLGNHIDTLLDQIGQDPALFFLDPFGLQLDATVVQRALRGPHNEVLALFADQAALRHFGAATKDPDPETEIRNMPPMLFEDMNVARAAEMRATAQKRTPVIAGTRKASIRILDAAYGGHEWYEVISAEPKAKHRDTFLALYEHMLRRYGAAHVLKLPVRNDHNLHVYHLMHATKSAGGYVAMKEAVEAALKSAGPSDLAVKTMRFLIRSDIDAVERAVHTKFVGQMVQWADDGRLVASVRRFALEHTAAFPSELSKLKERLLPLREPGRKTVYRFPP